MTCEVSQLDRGIILETLPVDQTLSSQRHITIIRSLTVVDVDHCPG